MKKVMFGLLNYTNDYKLSKKLVNRIPSPTPKHIMVATQSNELKSELNNNIIIPFYKNRAIIKNNFINIARENNATHLFMFNDNIEIKDYRVFEEYLKLIEINELSAVVAGFTSKINYVFNTPNPCVKISHKDKIWTFNRNIGKDFMLIKINDHTLYFDENLNELETEYYMLMHEELNPIYDHFRIDIDNAWKYFKPVDGISSSGVNMDNLEHDKIYRKSPIILPKNLDRLVETLSSRLKLSSKSFQVI